MNKNLIVRCGHCKQEHYIEESWGAEIIDCDCGASGAAGDISIGLLYNALATLYPTEEVDFVFSDDEVLNKFHILMDIVYEDYGNCSAIWAKRKVLDLEDALERIEDERE